MFLCCLLRSVVAFYNIFLFLSIFNSGLQDKDKKRTASRIPVAAVWKFVTLLAYTIFHDILLDSVGRYCFKPESKDENHRVRKTIPTARNPVDLKLTDVCKMYIILPARVFNLIQCLSHNIRDLLEFKDFFYFEI